MKHITLNIKEEIRKITPDTLEHCLHDNEIICPVCHGLGVVKQSFQFSAGHKTECLVMCPYCLFGHAKTCEYCGKVLQRNINKCNCSQAQQHLDEKLKEEYQRTIDKATEIDLQDCSCYLYDYSSGEFFSDECEFAEYWWNQYQEEQMNWHSFQEFFREYVPDVVWYCEEEKIHLDADNIIEEACENLHEDARDSVVDENELQEFLDKWCKKQSRTTTYFPCYEKYIKVSEEWFANEIK